LNTIKVLLRVFAGDDRKKKEMEINEIKILENHLRNAKGIGAKKEKEEKTKESPTLMGQPRDPEEK
jgi:hypothetical protein